MMRGVMAATRRAALRRRDSKGAAFRFELASFQAERTVITEVATRSQAS